MKTIIWSTGAGLIDDYNILSVPFCPYTILSIPFCPYHFVSYHFVLEPTSFSRDVTYLSPSSQRHSEKRGTLRRDWQNFQDYYNLSLPLLSQWLNTKNIPNLYAYSIAQVTGFFAS